MSTDASADRHRALAGAQAGRRGKTRLVRAAIAALLLGPLGLVATATIGSTPALAAGPTITGAGSSYAAVAVQNWAAQVGTEFGDSVDYSTSSSVIGLNLFAQNQVTFGASEIGYSTNQANYTPSVPYQYLPDIAGATCLMYNVKGRLGNQIRSLNLDSQVLAQIWTGTVTNWSAPQIAAINRGVDLPNSPIVAVYRTDASGENYIFSQYLDYLQPQIWVPFVQTLQAGAPVSAIFPSGTNHGHYNLANFVGQNGSDGSSDFVASVTGTMTYVETAYAILHKLPCAFIQNASGNWVAPSEETDAVGLERAQLLPDLEQKLQGVYSNPLPSAYPISAYSYLVTPKGAGSMSPAVGAVLGRFIRFFSCTGQNSAGALGYSPLPPNLVDADFAAINRIPGAAPAPAEATAANCSDPYVDGQTQLPGEPCIQGTNCNSNGGGPTTTTTTTPGSSPGTTPGGSSGTTPGGSQSTASTSKGKGKAKSASGGSKKTAAGGQHFGGQVTPGAEKAGNLFLANGQWPGQKIVPGAQPGANLSNGQTLGNELATEDFTLLGVRVSPGTMWGSVALLILLLALPPSLARLRKRRKLSRLQAMTPAGGPS